MCTSVCKPAPYHAIDNAIDDKGQNAEGEAQDIEQRQGCKGLGRCQRLTAPQRDGRKGGQGDSDGAGLEQEDSQDLRAHCEAHERELPAPCLVHSLGKGILPGIPSVAKVGVSEGGCCVRVCLAATGLRFDNSDALNDLGDDLDALISGLHAPLAQLPGPLCEARLDGDHKRHDGNPSERREADIGNKQRHGAQNGGR